MSWFANKRAAQFLVGAALYALAGFAPATIGSMLSRAAVAVGHGIGGGKGARW